jgi:hypothetical protein
LNCDEHLEAAWRILAGLAKMDPQADPLALIDGTMVAGYHLGNAMLHAHGVTAPSVHFNTPSKFEVPPDALPSTLKPVYEAFVGLEKLRSYYVRSPNEPDRSAALSAQQLLARMAELCGSAARGHNP